MANKRELLKEFGPKIIEVYGPDELKFLKENFSGEELEKYIKIDHDSFKGYKTSQVKPSTSKKVKAAKGKFILKNYVNPVKIVNNLKNT